MPEPRTVEQRPQQVCRRTTSRRTAGQHSRGTRRPAYSTRAAATLDVEESAEEETAATPSDTEEEDEEEEWSESSRCVQLKRGTEENEQFIVGCSRSSQTLIRAVRIVVCTDNC